MRAALTVEERLPDPAKAKDREEDAEEKESQPTRGARIHEAAKLGELGIPEAERGAIHMLAQQVILAG
jgi:hypothetical protein